jgi:DNA-binding transcriptional regulator YiaG
MAKKAKANGHGKPGHNKRSGTIRLYRKIIEHDHDPDMDEICSVIAKEGLTMSQAAMLSGVGNTTLANWEKKKTKRPQHLTMKATLAGIGYGFAIRQVEKIDYASEMVKAERWHEKRETERNQQKK